MRLKKLLEILNLINDKDIDVKVITGYGKIEISQLECTLKGNECFRQTDKNGNIINRIKYKNDTLFLVCGLDSLIDYPRRLETSLMTVARLNRDIVNVPDEQKYEYEYYLKLKEKYENSNRK